MLRYFILLTLFISNLAFGQSEQLIIPITNPGSPGKLAFDNYKGSIQVTGYDGDVVIVTALYRSNSFSGSNENGLKKIPVNDFQLTAEENNNEILLLCDCKGKTVDFDIKVPREFSLQLKTYENATITVLNVNGIIEASNLNGDIILTNIIGSAVISAIDGKIHASFLSVEFDTPMAFSSIEGNIEIAIPANTRANLKMKTSYGEVFSDFDIVLDKRKAKIEKDDTKSVIKFDEWTIGKINGGGAEYMINTHNGNIIIKSAD